MNVNLARPQELFSLAAGDVVPKRNLFDLIQYSKVVDSQYWGGEEVQIRNTPQQGVNWIGEPPACHGVIIKTRPGAYEEDGWAGKNKTAFHYSFKARSGKVSHSEKANAALINQPQYKYPVMLFTESGDSWVYEGTFSVSEIERGYVVLQRGSGFAPEQAPPQEEVLYQEGGRRYVTHLMAERNQEVVKALKARSASVCDICHMNFFEQYGVEYIEAHHKVPISTYSSSYVVGRDDFALLCPNCHRAVHIYMKKEGLEYPEIKQKLQVKEA
ncbi:HNH endonuclease [Natronospira bacteriovora]|uniref:HNH endonuclease n=1 Tax=Natronospira bacteriovora TaxID=3069753 RepID=A0ABU0W4H0_9GAMM|nr:HNH endonuclease [Natronospira sp. AB-CW4]MDQ2068653.1 HNH endonuclease [Natronospira sp. AB-CW4]